MDGVGDDAVIYFSLEQLRDVRVNFFAKGVLHEIGHVLGLTHGHPGDGNRNIIEPSARGFCNVSSQVSTIMYYPNECDGGLPTDNFYERSWANYFSRNDDDFLECNGGLCGGLNNDSLQLLLGDPNNEEGTLELLANNYWDSYE